MERYRLKNIIILILALLNAFLLAALSIRGSGARTARRTQQQKLVAGVISFPTEDLFVVYKGVNTNGDFRRIPPCLFIR